jgi:hypothetical protein
MGQGYDARFAPITAERIARNESVFRDANERIREAAEEHGADTRPVPFVCECAGPECREILRLTLAEYRSIRRDPARFLVAPGHQAAARGLAEVVAENDGYMVTEKLGEAREVAEELADGSGELAPPKGDGKVGS